MRATNEVKSTDGAATVTFDTLGAAQELRNAGFEGRQAEAVVTTISKAMSETVATKSDLKLMEQSVESRFDKMELRLEALENKIVLKLGGFIVTMTFLLLAVGPFYIRWVLSLMSAQ